MSYLKQHFRLWGLMLSAIIMQFTFLQHSISEAATIAVSTTNDEINTNGACSLREAIINANADNQSGSTDCSGGTGDDTISLPGGTYILSLGGAGENLTASGDLDISGNLVLNGAGSNTTIINGNNNDRIFDIDPNASGSITVEINDITIQNGLSGDGAGIYNRDVLIITGSVITNNTSTDDAGGIYIDSGGKLTITDSTISNNSANGDDGGGILCENGAIALYRCLICNNNALDVGGGIRYNGSLSLNKTFVLSNCTISGNTAKDTTGVIGQAGGGLYISIPATLGTAAINNATVTSNSAPNSDGGGGIYVNDDGDGIIMRNTIVAGNTSGGAGNYPDIKFTGGMSITSDGYNLIGNRGSQIFVNNTGDQIGAPGSIIDAKLEALADNGGPTMTHALQSDSPAIENGNPASCEVTDQRWVARPQPAGAICDIGAFEYILPSTIPTFSQWGMFFFALILSMVALFCLRKQTL